MKRWRIGIAEISHQTVSFNPQPSTFADFERRGVFTGLDIPKNLRGSRVVGGLLHTLESEPDVELVPLVSAASQPTAGGLLEEATLKRLLKLLLQAMEKAGPFDGIVFAAAGTSASELYPDVTGYILECIRNAVGAEVRVVASLDHHANVTRKIIEHSDFISAFHTQPHDLIETGKRSAGFLLEILRKGNRPACAWQKIPMMTPQERFQTGNGPMKAWFDLAREMERRPGVLAVNTFPMQPWLDAPEAGWSVVVHTSDSAELAGCLCAEAAEKAWWLRGEFWKGELVEPAAAVGRVGAMKHGLAVLCDVGDSVLGGSTGDNTTLLRAFLDADGKVPVAVPLIDPAALAICRQAVPGDTLELELGGNASPLSGNPIQTEVTLLKFSDCFRIKDERLGFVDGGPCALLGIGALRVGLLAARSYAVALPEFWKQWEIDIAGLRGVVVKTAGNFYAYDPWRTELLYVNTPGMTQHDLTSLPFKHLPHPTWPFQQMEDWKPAPMVRKSRKTEA